MADRVGTSAQEVEAVARQSAERDWVEAFADEVVAAGERRCPGAPVVVASGISPSGPIHLGNLREIMTPHFVADEIRRRGTACRHILSWDDYDRLRRVPAGYDPAWSQHIGKPLTSVPAPEGSPNASWAEHFKAPLRAALRELGVECEEISQTERYTSGAYRSEILRAMARRREIDAVLERYRTKGSSRPAASRMGAGEPPRDAGTDSAREARAGTTSEIPGGRREERDGDYYPYRPYCSACERDLTTILSYDDSTTALAYRCACGHAETVTLAEYDRGKLVWKVDWPMRWAYERVVFEPSGVDHQSPGSSFVVGGELAREIFQYEPPIGPMYAFVGITGMAKMSSSRGGVPTPTDALSIMEAPVLRFLYARRRPSQSFTVAFGDELHRLYDEWDALGLKVAARTASPAQTGSYDRAIRTAAGMLASTPRPMPYRMLTSVVDITTGETQQILRILRDLDPAETLEDLDAVRPRLDCARNWVETEMPAEERTVVKDQPDRELLSSLGEEEAAAIELLVDGLATHWSLRGLTTLVYAVPKLQAGLDVDAVATPEIKARQRLFFALVYRLLIGRETGPRLPTLLLALGPERVRALLGH